MSLQKTIGTLTLLLYFVALTACKNESSIEAAQTFLTVTTNDISGISQTTAISGGNISSDSGELITERGVCWSINTTPTIADSKTSDSSGTGSFTSYITGLVENTTYNVRAYATNSQGTVYGNNLSFTTKHDTIGTIAFTIEEKDLFPEGIAYDPITKQIFLSSIRKDKILAVDQLGNRTDFISPKQDGMLHSLGLKVDAARRRLWVVSNSDWTSNVISAIHIYNIDSKILIKSFFTERGSGLVFNDLVLTITGGAYISAVENSSIFEIPSDLNKVELFVKSNSLLVGANGLALSPDDSLLYAATLTKGIVRIDVNSKTIQQITNNTSIKANGIDGLLFYKNSLIGIANGESALTKHYIARYQLSGDGSEIVSASMIDEHNPLFATPTTGFIFGDEFYCLAATYLHYFTLGGYIDPRVGNPIILKYYLN
jgi:hypothetical protein